MSSSTADGFLPLKVALSTDIEHRPDRAKQYRGRVRWIDPSTRKRRSVSEAFTTQAAAQNWINTLQQLAHDGVSPATATMTLAEYGESVMPLALRGLESKTLDPYLAGWRRRIVPTLGHLAIRMITNGAVDRAVHAWIADEHSRSTVKNSLAVLVRVLDQAVRDGVIDRNVAHVTGWQHQFRKGEDELDNPRALALPDWPTLLRLSNALIARSADHYQGWGDVVTFAACTGARIGEVSGCRTGDIDTNSWLGRRNAASPGYSASSASGCATAPNEPCARCSPSPAC